MRVSHWIATGVLLGASLIAGTAVAQAAGNDLPILTSGGSIHYLYESGYEDIVAHHSEDSPQHYGRFDNIESDFDQEKVGERLKDVFGETSHVRVRWEDEPPSTGGYGTGYALRCRKDGDRIGVDSSGNETHCFEFYFDTNAGHYFIKSASPKTP